MDWADVAEPDRERALLVPAIRKNPGDADLRYRLAEVYESIGNYRKSLRQARRAVALTPANLLYREFLAHAYFRTFDTRRAIHEMKRLTELDPDESYYRITLAQWRDCLL